MSSAICFNLDLSQILSSGNGLIKAVIVFLVKIPVAEVSKLCEVYIVEDQSTIVPVPIFFTYYIQYYDHVSQVYRVKQTGSKPSSNR